LKSYQTIVGSERNHRIFLNLYVPIFSTLLVYVIFHSLYFGTTNFYEIWSFRVQDPPWMPDNLQAYKILGNHFFGDFQLPYGAAYIENGYKGDFVTILPFGFILYKIATLFSVQASLILFTFLGFAVFYTSIYVWIEKHSNLRHLLAFSLTAMSIPVWVAVDRGALSLLTVGLMGIVLKRIMMSVEKNSKNGIKISWIDAVLISLVVSWKIYFIIPIFLVFLFSFREFCKKILFVLLSTNFLASFIVAGSPIVAINGLLRSYLTQAGDGNPGWIFGGVSLSKLIASLYWYSHSYEQSIAFSVKYSKYLLIPGLFFVGYLVLKFLRTEFITKNLLVAALSTSFLIIPVAGSYTLVVCGLCIAIMLGDSTEKVISNSRILLILVCTLSLLPLPTNYYLTVIPLFWVLTALVILLLGTFKKKEKT